MERGSLRTGGLPPKPGECQDGNRREVLIHDDGTFVTEWRLEADANPEVYSPTRVAVASGRAYFLVRQNDGIGILDSPVLEAVSSRG